MAAEKNAYTIYLTEPEAERIRNTVKGRAKNCSERAGEAKEPRDKTAAHQQATGAALMADMGGAPDPDTTQAQGKGAGTIPAIGVGQPYPPCTAPLSRLEPMKMADLRMESHHRGKKLVVKRESPVVPLVARSWTMVQSEDGTDAERLEVCLHKSRHGEDVLESSKSFILKEPYFTMTEQGEPTIRVDHPSDLFVCLDDPQAKKTFEDTAEAEKVAIRFKKQGNTALKQQDLPLAHEKYTLGLKVASQKIVTDSNPDLARDIYRNRAYVNLLLDQLDEVKTDAQASLTGREDETSKELDSKAYYRAGSAAYNQGRWQEAKRFFEEQQKLVPGDKDAKMQLKRIGLRLRDEETGSYDLMKMRNGLSQARPRVDAGTFIRNTEVKDSAGKGRGLYATRNIAPGEIIMCERAFRVVWGHEEDTLTAMTYDVRDDKIRVTPVGLCKAIVQKLFSNPSQIESFMDLYGDYKGPPEGEYINEDGAVVDVFRVYDIVARNAFGPGKQFSEENARNASTGLWIHAAYTNHSCIANATKEFTGDLIILRAIRPIKTGDEILHSYDASLDYDARQSALMHTWGFECNCALCAAEKADGKALRDKRMELMGEADAFVERTPWAGAKRIGIRKAQRLAQSIEETYDSDRWKDLPRSHVDSIRTWLLKASPR